MPERFLASAIPQHEAAELYRLMVVGIKEVAVFLMNADGIITVWNKAAEVMKGYSADDAIGQHLRLLYTDADKAEGHPEFALSQAAAHGVFTEERWRKRKNGSLFWAHIVLTALRDQNERLIGFSKVTMDLTRHKLLEQCEKEKQEIDLILSAAESGTWKWDVGSGKVAISHHLLSLLGYEDRGQELDFDCWLRYVHAGDRRAFRLALERASGDLGATPLETELRFLHQNGDYHWFFMRINWHRDDPKPSPVFVGACVHIDHLKAAEAERAGLYEQLKRERARFASVLDQLPSGVVLAEVPSGKFSYQNRMAVSLIGSMSDIVSVNEYDRFHFLDTSGRPIASSELPLVRLMRGVRGVQTEEIQYQTDDGGRRHFAVTAALINELSGERNSERSSEPQLAVAVLHDISQLKQAELSAATEKERAVVTLASIADGVVTVDRAGRVTSLNAAAERLTGVASAEALGQPLAGLLSYDEDDGAARMAEAIDACLAERRVRADLPGLTIRSRHGQHYSVEHAIAPVALDDGELIGAVLTLHDVTESKRLMHRLGFEASHDALTGLINRREFEVRLQRAIDRAHAGGEESALLYMDLDQFKIVNDTCGHQAGDELLKKLAATYHEHKRERDCFARIGGDEFALIVEHCSVDEALGVAQKILEATRAFRYVCKGRQFQLGVSIGVTPIDAGTAQVEEAMRRADHACYIAKDRGRNRIYVHYQGDLDFAQRRSDMHWVTRLTHAFQRDQLQLYCQPIVALEGDDQQLHYEILLRLRNGRAGPIAPGTFLPAAERYDVILKIDRWVLERTLEWLARHPAHTEELYMCSINLSRRSLADPTFHQFAADLIDRSSVDAAKLCFEITEHGAIADMQKTIAFIEALSARGCRFSLDDFGTGMTSFSYLKQLPVDFIKIDGSFVQMMRTSEVDYEMVRFTNDISHMMGRKTIAEYVTDPAMLEDLTRIGVDFAQGYWVGKPRPLAA